MDEHGEEIAEPAVATLVRGAGEPLPADLNRRIRTTIKGQLDGDLLVDTFDDTRSGESSDFSPAPVPRRRWLLVSAAAVVASVGVGWVIAIGDRGEGPRTTAPELTPPTTADVVREGPVSIVSTDSPTGERSVGRRMGLPDQPGDLVSSEFLPDGRLLRWSTTEDGEVATLYGRWAIVESSAVLPKGTATAGAGDRTMRDIAVGPDDVLYASYLSSVTPDGWHFDVVAYSFEQQPRELGRWPAYRTCSVDCGEVMLASDGVVIDDDGGYIRYVDPSTGLPSGKRQYYVPDEVQASYETMWVDGRRVLGATVSYGDEAWKLRIEKGTPLPDVSAEQPLELQPQRDGSVMGVLFGEGDADYPFFVLWLRPGGGVELYGLDASVLPRVMYSVGGVSILALGVDTDSRRQVLVRL